MVYFSEEGDFPLTCPRVLICVGRMCMPLCGPRGRRTQRLGSCAHLTYRKRVAYSMEQRPCSLWPSISRVSEGKMLPYLACYHIWHVTIYGMLTYLACYHIWHVAIYGMLKYLACYHIWYFTIYLNKNSTVSLNYTIDRTAGLIGGMHAWDGWEMFCNNKIRNTSIFCHLCLFVTYVKQT